MNLIPVSSPDGTFEGWISPSLIIAVSANPRYFDYAHPRRGMRSGVVPYGMPDTLVVDALDLKTP